MRTVARRPTRSLVETSEDERKQPLGLGIEPLSVIDRDQNRGRGSRRNDHVEHAGRERSRVPGHPLPTRSRAPAQAPVCLRPGQCGKARRFRTKEITEAAEDQGAASARGRPGGDDGKALRLGAMHCVQPETRLSDPGLPLEHERASATPKRTEQILPPARAPAAAQ